MNTDRLGFLMEVILSFGVGRIIYAFIDRFPVKLIILEVIFTVGYVITSKLLMSMENVEARSVTIGFVFLISGIISRLLHGKPPVEAPRKDVLLGIIDFAWIAIMGLGLAIVYFLRNVSPLINPLPTPGYNHEYYLKLYETTQFLMGWVLNVVPILGAIVGAAMGILLAGELWTKKDESVKSEYAGLTFAAIKMPTAYFIVVIPFLYWLAIPLYYRMVFIVEFLK